MMRNWKLKDFQLDFVASKQKHPTWSRDLVVDDLHLTSIGEKSGSVKQTPQMIGENKQNKEKVKELEWTKKRWCCLVVPQLNKQDS